MPNIFDQFDAAPAGVRPQVEAPPTAGNPFDQFDNAPGEGPSTIPLPRPRPGPTAGSLYQSVYENPMLGAEQRTVPHVEQYGPPLSTELFRGETGEVSFRDKSGNVIPTDKSKHVVLNTSQGPAVFARSAATEESPAVGGARVLSLGLGPTVPSTAAVAPVRTAPAIEATIPGLRTAAESVYQNPEILSRAVRPADVAASFNEISPELRRFDPAITQRLSNELSGLGRDGITIADLNHASERLGEIAAEVKGPLGNQSATSAAAAAQIVKRQIDNLIRVVAPEMATADQNYAAMKAAQTIVGRGDLARVRARGGDFAEKMAQQATTLLANPKYTRGFTPEELDQLRQISEGSLSGERLRQAGSWLSGRIAQLGVAAGGLVGYQHSGAFGAAMGMVGSAAVEGAINSVLTRLGNRMTENQINTLSSAIRARSPLGQQLAQNAADWEAAWRDIRSTPSSVTLTALARSSRELSNALRSVGVKIGPAQLMRGGQADENQ